MDETSQVEPSYEIGKPFDPTRFLKKISGNDYLEVKWRIAWFRAAHPDGSINTEWVPLSPGIAMFKATVSGGGGSATGYGTETPDDFKDYIEKAETKAIGRALGALGYGTQFAFDHDFNAGSKNPTQYQVVDSPGSAAQYGQGQQAAATPNRQRAPQEQSAPPPVQAHYPPAPVQQPVLQPAPQPVQQPAPQQSYAAPQQPQQAPQQSYVAPQQTAPQQMGQQNPNGPATPRQMQFVADLLVKNGYDVNEFDLSGWVFAEASAWITALKTTGKIPSAAP